MYSVVLMAAMAQGGESPDFLLGLFRRDNGCCGGCNGSSCHGYSYGCCGGYSCHGSCYGCGGCCGGGYSYGCCGGYSCHGSCYGCGGCCGGGYSYGCCGGGCYGGGCHGMNAFSCHGCYGAGYSFGGCYGAGFSAQPIYGSPVVPAGPTYGSPAPMAPVTPPVDGGMQEKKDGKEDDLGIDGVSANAAKLVIDVPAGGELFIDGQKIDGVEGLTKFHTPALKRGKEYYYEVKVVLQRDGQKVEDEKKVIVKAGKTFNESFAGLSEKLDRALAKAGR